jgi:hypothetical protein
VFDLLPQLNFTGLANVAVDLVGDGGAQLKLNENSTTRARDLLKNKAVYTLARINVAEGGGQEVEQLTFEVPADP